MRNIHNIALIIAFVHLNGTSFACSAQWTNENGFLTSVQNIMENFDKKKILRLKKANILIAPDKTQVIAYISGKSPIMTTNYKNAIAQSLNCKLNDVFDVISYQNEGEATSVRDCLLFYAKYSELYENLKCLESGKGEKGAIYTIGANLERIIDMCKENVDLQAFETALTGSKEKFLKYNTSVISLIESKDKQKKQPGGKTLYVTEAQKLKAEILQLHKSIFPDIQFIKSEVQKKATKAIKTYLDNLKLYYKSISQIDPGTANAALFGWEILSKAPVDTQIAYTVAPCKITECTLHEVAEKQTAPTDIADGFFKQQWEIATNSQNEFWKVQPMYGVVKLFHSEPMYIYKNINQVPMPFFFTQRDMCETCAPLVSKFAVTQKSRINVISMQACCGQTQQESIVDFVYENAEITETKPNQQKLSNVRRIRIPNFLTIKLSSDLLKNIPET